MKSSYQLPIRSETEQTLLDQENQEYFEKQGSKQAAGPTSLLHENLRSFRLRRQYKKREMAEFMRVTPRTYYTYENGSRPVPSSALVNLATITKIDLNELMLGRRATPDAQIAKAAIVDIQFIMKRLRAEYPDMDADTRYEVACCAITTDWGDWPRMHPEIIHAALFKGIRPVSLL